MDMPVFFWIALLFGYLIGVGAAVIVNSQAAIEPLVPYLIVSSMVAVSLLVWLALRLAFTDQDIEPEAETVLATASKARDQELQSGSAPPPTVGDDSMEPSAQNNRFLEEFEKHKAKPGELAALVIDPGNHAGPPAPILATHG